MVKIIYWIQHTKKNRSTEKMTKAGKHQTNQWEMLYMKKTMKNIRNRIYVKLVNNEKGYLKRTWKPNYMSHKIFDNNLVSKRKSKMN